MDYEEEFDDVPDESEECTIPCPFCGRAIHEDSQRCPYCEQYITEEHAPPARKPWWIVVGALICLYIVYRWIVG
jgi:predicted nucleic acid-binding Zn ribbon protein